MTKERQGKRPARKRPSEKMEERRMERTPGQDLTASLLSLLGEGMENSKAAVMQPLKSAVSGATIGMKIGDEIKKYRKKKASQRLGSQAAEY